MKKTIRSPRRRALLFICLLMLLPWQAAADDGADIRQMVGALEDNIFDFAEMEDLFSSVMDTTDFGFNLLGIATLDNMDTLLPSLHRVSEHLEAFSADLLKVEILRMLVRGEFSQASMAIIKDAMSQGIKLFAHGGLYAAGIGIIDFALNYTAEAIMSSIDRKYLDRYTRYNMGHSWQTIFRAVEQGGYEGLADLLDGFWSLEEVEYARDLYTFRARNPNAVDIYRQMFIRDYLLEVLLTHGEVQKRRREAETAAVLHEMARQWNHTQVVFDARVVERYLPTQPVSGTVALVLRDELVAEAHVSRGGYVSLRVPVYKMNELDLWNNRFLSLEFRSDQENTMAAAHGTLLPGAPKGISVRVVDYLNDPDGHEYLPGEIRLPRFTIPAAHKGTVYFDPGDAFVMIGDHGWIYGDGSYPSSGGSLEGLPYGRYIAVSRENGVIREFTLDSTDAFVSFKGDPVMPEYVEITYPPVEFHHERVYAIEELPDGEAMRPVETRKAVDIIRDHYEQIALEASSATVVVRVMIGQLRDKRRESRAASEREFYDAEIERLEEVLEGYQQHVQRAFQARDAFLGHPGLEEARSREEALQNLWRLENERNRAASQVRRERFAMQAQTLDRELRSQVWLPEFPFYNRTPEQARSELEKTSESLERAVAEAREGYRRAAAAYETYLEYQEKIDELGVVSKVGRREKLGLNFFEGYRDAGVIEVLEQSKQQMLSSIASQMEIPEEIQALLDLLEKMQGSPPSLPDSSMVEDRARELASLAGRVLEGGNDAEKLLAQFLDTADQAAWEFSDFLISPPEGASSFLKDFREVLLELNQRRPEWGIYTMEIWETVREANALESEIRSSAAAAAREIDDARLIESYPGDTLWEKLEHLQGLEAALAQHGEIARTARDFHASMDGLLSAYELSGTLPRQSALLDIRDEMAELFQKRFFSASMASYCASRGLFYPEVTSYYARSGGADERHEDLGGLLVLDREQVQELDELELHFGDAEKQLPFTVAVKRNTRAERFAPVHYAAVFDNQAVLLLDAWDIQGMFRTPEWSTESLSLISGLPGAYYELLEHTALVKFE